MIKKVVVRYNISRLLPPNNFLIANNAEHAKNKSILQIQRKNA
jgi:hypothetical protein